MVEPAGEGRPPRDPGPDEDPGREGQRGGGVPADHPRRVAGRGDDPQSRHRRAHRQGPRHRDHHGPLRTEPQHRVHDKVGNMTARIGINEADRARNRAMGAGLGDDPYPRYHELRATGPVHQGTIPEHLGLADPRATHTDGHDYSAYSWATVDQVLRDDGTFSNASYAPALEPFIGRTILQMDGVEHRRYRGLAQPGLARGDMARWQSTWVDP